MPRRCLVASATERVRTYPEPAALAEHRRRLLRRASGRVLDLSLRPEPNRAGLSTGPVTALTVVSGGTAPARLWVTAPEEGGPGHLGDVRLMTGSLHADTFDPGSFDTVVSVLTLCTVDLAATMLAAVARWLTPTGQLLVLEHIRATGLTAMAQAVVTPFERLLVGGCHLDQDLVRACRQAGLDLTDGARFSARVAGSVPIPFFAGVARPRSRHAHLPQGLEPDLP